MKKELFSILKVYVSTWFITLLVFIIIGYRSDLSILESIKFFGEALTRLNFVVALHIFFLTIYIIYLIFRYFIRIYKKKGVKTMIKQFSFRLLIPVLVLYGTIQLIVINNSSENLQYTWDNTVENISGCSNDLYRIDGKHRGMSVFGWNNSNNEKGIDDLVRTNVEWVAVIPFFYQENEKTLEMGTPKTVGQWSKRDSLFIKTIRQLKDKNIHVMLKPHLWLGSGWRSNITQTSSSDWDTWFESYRSNMLHYAKLAAMTNVELLCIGTELKSSLKSQPAQWRTLLKEIKTVYKGKLTYAANWDGEYELIDFWDELDYIGIQAYFPLTLNSNPNLDTIKNGWDTHMNMLSELSKKHQKPVLFTEIGYKSESSATIKPWEWGSFFSILTKQKSDRTQQLAYQALYQQLWHKDWFAGTYIWQWNTRSEKENAPTNLDFSPRYKPAENVITKWYGNYSLK
ncbi:glycoside hydrolase family 113 [Aquimarina sp. 2201CG14-23]|uniref:glycoside hydrolase family 113 n=1 Tax=Aquimarina mycalae TaxID=3040073 RepID=UPI0024781A13|nr:hypothetical protein [Aquimarina sp. 2201CG14-23]MDH7445557.1 hypothetical protein [Aquimarina sp. 2201CG14-23]